MHRIDGAGATPENLFTEGNPISGIPATTVTADFLNAVQEEICGVVEAAGATLDKPDNAQLLAAIQSLIALHAPSQWFTGDVKLTLADTAPDGWVLMNDGTVGDAASGATTRANADCEDLFTLLWENITDTYAPVSGGRGASAAADWSAGKTISLTRMLGRALAIAGSGSTLTARTLGQYVGAETHTLTVSEIPAHNHEINAAFPIVEGAGWSRCDDTANADKPVTRGSKTTISTGGDGAHNNMQPTAFLNALIKL